ncbi:MAG: energy-coupling factor transporter transmembrane component T family protein [Promethearchaeota archaeon]
MERNNAKVKQKSEIWIVLWTYFKILLLIGINITVFLAIPFWIFWIIFGLELILGVLIKVKFDKIIPILKFITINLIPIYFILYFHHFDWVLALYDFGVYTSKIFVLLFSLIIFSQTTPNSILITSISKIGVPKRISFIIATTLTLLPGVSAELRNIVKMQKARGYKVNIFRLKPILVPLVLNLMNYSINLSLSLESRGFEL